MQRVKVILVLVFIAFLISMYFAGTGYFKQVDRVDAANTQIDELHSKIDKAEADLADVPAPDENEISQLESQLATETNRLPPQASVIQNEVVRTLLGLGYKHAVTVVPLNNNQWNETRFVSDTTYFQLSMTFVAQGSWRDLVEFMKDLEATNYLTLMVDNVSVAIQPPILDEDGEVIGYEDNPRINIAITIYTK